MLLNILSNAIKFTKKGNIHFDATCVYENGEAVLKFIVSDTGMGIKEKDMKKLLVGLQIIITVIKLNNINDYTILTINNTMIVLID